MGHVTNVHFGGELNIDGVRVPGDMTTQIRWDMGIGEMFIDSSGKISKVDHIWPLDLEQREAFNVEMLVYTGVLDANIGQLFFHEGQLMFLDFTVVEGVAIHFLTTFYQATGIDVSPSCDRYGHDLPKAMPDADWESLKAALEQARLDLLSDNTLYPDHIKQLYRDRPTSLVDPFYYD